MLHQFGYRVAGLRTDANCTTVFAAKPGEVNDDANGATNPDDELERWRKKKRNAS